MADLIEAPRAHAILSASGSKKWLTCTPSARFEEQFPDEDSEFSLEGTFAHAVFEQELLNFLGLPVDPLPKDLMRFDSVILREHVKKAVDFAVNEILLTRGVHPDALILVEQKLDFSRWVPEGFGTGDLVIVTPDYVEVMDLKYGAGVFVPAQDNSQMRLYGLGALSMFGNLYDSKRVRTTVLQPRMDNFGSEAMAVPELLAWAESEVVPKAAAAWAGEGEFVPGSHCSDGFCKARYVCAARGQQALTLAKQDFALRPPAELTDDQILRVLEVGAQVTDWIGDVREHALKRALSGDTWPGYKVVEGRSVRKIVDQEAAAAALVKAGVPEAVIYDRVMRGITALETILGKNRFAEVLGDHVEKPPGKATLVPESDKRQAISSSSSAQEDFQ